MSAKIVTEDEIIVIITVSIWVVFKICFKIQAVMFWHTHCKLK